MRFQHSLSAVIECSFIYCCTRSTVRTGALRTSSSQEPPSTIVAGEFVLQAQTTSTTRSTLRIESWLVEIEIEIEIDEG